MQKQRLAAQSEVLYAKVSTRGDFQDTTESKETCTKEGKQNHGRRHTQEQ